MTEHIVEKYPGSDLQIYTVWVNQRVTDARDTVDPTLVRGSRQYWDSEWATGRWLAEKDLGGLGYTGAVYDVYYLFGEDATWDDVPGPLVVSGGPVVDASGLEAAVDKLL